MDNDKFQNAIRMVVFILFAILTLSTGYYIFVSLVLGWSAPPTVTHLANYVLAAEISLVVVLALKYTIGPIELSMAKLKFKGASGPIIFWAICFFVTSSGIAILAP
ncbi:hypothetical protein AB6C73_26360 [Vibrio splendidus]